MKNTDILALKYRPHRFEDVVEQDVVKQILLNKLRKKTFSNCLLFFGGAGTGKTTSARIFAQEVNNFTGAPIEIDAASNNSVDNIRAVIQEARTLPIGMPYKVFIFDEAHMLSMGAWNAFLKLLEEPPKSALFILATTDPQKLPNTIISRTQQYEFTKISTKGIIDRLKFIIDSENKEHAGDSEYPITYEDAAIEFIAKLGEGGMRRSITLLETALGYTHNLTVTSVVESLGTVDYDVMFNLANAVYNMQTEHVIDIIEKYDNSGKDLKLFVKNFVNFIVDVSKYGMFKHFDYIQIPSSYESKLSEFTDDAYIFFKQLMNEMLALSNNIKWESSPKPLIEATFIQLCTEA